MGTIVATGFNISRFTSENIFMIAKGNHMVLENTCEN